ncbi:MAG: hypothetical protein KIT36_20750 [Alphaproteobacteria bacterium]|nr:hypothetical protein [Alphaproteobacteria bacterium]
MPVSRNQQGWAVDRDGAHRSWTHWRAGDYTGTVQASRVELYERFYLTSGARNQPRSHQRTDRTRAMALVQRFLDEKPM